MGNSHSIRSFVVVAVVSVVALIFSYFAGAGSVEIFGYSALYVCGWIALLVNWLAFIPAAAAQSDKYYDTVGAITYLTVIGVASYAAWPLDARGPS